MNLNRLPFMLFILIFTFSNTALADADSSRTDSNSNSNRTEDEMSSTTVVVVAAAITIYGLSFGAAMWSSSEISEDDKEEVNKELARYLQQNHSSVTRDVLAAQGPFWEHWRSEAGLTQDEINQFQIYFSGSTHQTKMLHLLNSDLTPAKAEAFGIEMVHAFRQTLSEDRFRESVSFALNRVKTVKHQAG